MKFFDFLDIGGFFESIINWLTIHADFIFDAISVVVEGLLNGFTALLLVVPPVVMVLLLTAAAWIIAKKWMAVFTLIGFFLIMHMGLWRATMQTLSLVLTSVIIALATGVPIGIWAAKKDTADKIIRPILDFMQTLPAFVYLIPAVLFFKLGPVPGVIATLIF
jgi:glycine betaine/proline transport system permease protein